MKKILLILLLLFLPSCTAKKEIQGVRTVLVSVLPYKFLVEEIAGNTIEIDLLVPSGTDPHAFEPTPKQALKAIDAEMWFQNGMGFEPQLQQVLLASHPHLKIVDLRHKKQEMTDPHIWLSPKRVKNQAKVIAQTLIEHYPKNQKLYQENLKALLDKLDLLDQNIVQILNPLKKRIILVSHPAFGYFCEDYNLKQIAIESEGREPTPYHVEEVFKQAREANIQTLFVQAQHLSKGSKLIAKELGAKIVTVDPLRENYFENMVDIAKNFASQENNKG